MDDVSVNFIELIALTRITSESTVEKFGSLINSSFFDASNILATLKQKGLVDFVTAFPSQSTLKVTEKGTALIDEANKKAGEPIDALDMAILSALGGGRKSLTELGTTLNVAQKDLAMHIFKLTSQQSLSYELVNATISMSLTEKGFVSVRSVPAQPGTVTQQQVQASAEQAMSKTQEDEIKRLESMARRNKMRKRTIMIVVAALIIIVAVIVVTRFIIPLG